MKPPVIFISATNADYSAAREVYQFLAGRGVDSFFCDESLLRVGEQSYRAKMDKALAQAGQLIVVAGSRTQAESEWVRHAWTGFANRTVAGDSKSTILTVLCGGLEGDDLPRTLRRGCMIRFPEELESLQLAVVNPGEPKEAARAAGAPSRRRRARILAVVTAANVVILGATIWLLGDRGIRRLFGQPPATEGTERAAGATKDDSAAPENGGERSGKPTTAKKGALAAGSDPAAVDGTLPPDEAAERVVYPDAGRQGVLDLSETPAPGTPYQLIIGGGVRQTFCFIPAGTFLMGSPPDETGRDEDENQHRVTLTKPFWLASTECTQSLWRLVMSGNPSTETGFSDLPVDAVSWTDIAGPGDSFLAKLNAKSLLPPGWRFVLPTEAQWEYACRAGTMTPFSFGSNFDSARANCDGWQPYGKDHTRKFVGPTTRVASYPPNRWGLYDMHGNVWEWCADRYAASLVDSVDPLGKSGANRTRRGGSWRFNAGICRSASRDDAHPDVRDDTLGFRIAIVTAE